MKEFFTLDDMQDLLGISKGEIVNLANGGMLPHGKMRGGVRKWTFGKLMSWVLELQRKIGKE